MSICLNWFLLMCIEFYWFVDCYWFLGIPPDVYGFVLMSVHVHCFLMIFTDFYWFGRGIEDDGLIDPISDVMWFRIAVVFHTCSHVSYMTYTWSHMIHIYIHIYIYIYVHELTCLLYGFIWYTYMLWWICVDLRCNTN